MEFCLSLCRAYFLSGFEPGSSVTISIAGEPLWGRMPKLSINYEDILSRAHGNSEDQNKVLESSTLIISYFIIIYAHNYIA